MCVGEDRLEDQEGDGKMQRTAMLREKNAEMQELEKDREA